MGLFSPTWRLRPRDKCNEMCQSFLLEAESEVQHFCLICQYQVERDGGGGLGAWLLGVELVWKTHNLQRNRWHEWLRESGSLCWKSPRNPSWQAFCMQLNRQMNSAARISQESHLMSVTQKISGHWWSDKLLCLRAVALKLEHASESPGGLVKT